MAARIHAEEILDLALIPVRSGNHARHCGERGRHWVKFRLDRDQLTGWKREDVVEAEPAATIALVGAGHDYQAGLPFAGESGAGLRERVRGDAHPNCVRDRIERDAMAGKTLAERVDHGATPRTPATAVKPSRSAGGSHTPMTNRAARGIPTNAA